MRALSLALLSLFAVACVGPEDVPSNVHDLRVLAAKFDPPEVFIPGCNGKLLQQLLYQSQQDGGIDLNNPALRQFAAAAAKPVTLTTLIVDPKGAGRSLRYHLRTCASQSDHACSTVGESLELTQGTTTAGELKLSVSLGAQVLADGTPLLFKVIEKDDYRGFGGIRVPVVLQVAADDTGEDLFAAKLMVFQCPLVEGMTPNVQPQLPGMTMADAGWPDADGGVLSVQGTHAVAMEPMDFSSLEESYVVPSFQLQPVQLQEAWKVSWYTTMGTMSPNTTGGTDFAGVEGAHRNKWTPDDTVTAATDVQFWFVVRDGRGGENWLTRSLHWSP
jgi:hypothetical protein